MCNNLMPILRIVAYLLKIIQWVIPILLIALSTFDFVKSIMASDEKDMAQAKAFFAKRIVYAVIVFLVPLLVELLFELVSSTISGSEYIGATKWINCFKEALRSV